MNNIPIELYNGYTMDGKVSIRDMYFAPSSNRANCVYLTKHVEDFIQLVKDKQPLHYPETDIWLYQALELYPIKDKRVLIIGSEEPCYEAAAINYGANEVVLVEYQKVYSTYPKIKTITTSELEKSNELFDVSISISSVEHSGLGRYGDTLDPDGDLKAMQVLHSKLKEGGICYLSVPIGLDQIIWNAHRIYGEHRFPLLVKGWDIIATIGFEMNDFSVDEFLKRENGKNPHRPGVSGGAHQPIFILRKK
jgi:hypothetical protein